MTRRALVAALLLVLPGPAFAIRHVIVGNEPLGPGHGFGKELLTAVNVEERVYLSEHDGDLSIYFKGGPAALNRAFRHFAALPADKREIFLLPVPARPLLHNKPIAYDWMLYVPEEDPRPRRGARLVGRTVTLTVYIPEPLPAPPADPARAKQWIADLSRDDFKTRERAARELLALGPPVAGLLREALTARPSAEARDRMEKMLADVSREIRLDVLELPAGVPVTGLDDLLDGERKRLADKDPAVRGNAVHALVDHGAPAAEVLPDIETMLKTETDRNAVAGAAWAAYHLGAGARPVLPALRAATARADKDIADICRQAIKRVEAAKAEPVPAAEAKKRATIRAEIKAFVTGRRG